MNILGTLGVVEGKGRGSSTGLGGCNEDLAILRGAQVVHDPHEVERLCLGFLGLRNMQIHLIAIEVCIVGATDALIEPQCPAQQQSS